MIVVLLLTVATGCAGSETKPSRPSSPPPDLGAVQGDRTVTLSVGVGPRTALVHHPASAGGGAPLVLVLHGESSTAQQAREQYGWDALADREGFVVAYPNSDGPTWNVSPTCCGPSHNQDTNDVGFLHQLVSAIGKADFIGRSRVYAVGFSTGATLAYSYACTLPGELAGIGAVAGSLAVNCPILAPITVAAVHGSNDHTVPIGGGPDPRAGNALQHHPLEATLTLFRTLDKCPDQPTTTTGPPASQRSWTCVASNSVSVAIIDQAGHQWPGATPPAEGTQPPTLAVDQPSTALNATDWLWTHLRDARSR